MPIRVSIEAIRTLGRFLSFDRPANEAVTGWIRIPGIQDFVDQQEAAKIDQPDVSDCELRYLSACLLVSLW